MKVLSIDELNILNDGNYNVRSMPYSKFFGEMELNKEQKQKRIDLATSLEQVMMFLFYLVISYEEYGKLGTNKQSIVNQTVQKYKNALSGFIPNDNYTEMYIREFARDFVDVTTRHLNEPYYLSQDRAMLMAENESNSMFNYSEYSDALEYGYKRKIWHTEKDLHVRGTHIPMESKTTEIDEPFLVGNSLMLFPRDTSYGANAEEIVNCRCTIEYIK